MNTLCNWRILDEINSTEKEARQPIGYSQNLCPVFQEVIQNE